MRSGVPLRACSAALLLCWLCGCNGEDSGPAIAPLAARAVPVESVLPSDLPADSPATSTPVTRPEKGVPLRGRPSASHARMLRELQRSAEEAEQNFPWDAGRTEHFRRELAATSKLANPRGYLNTLFDAS